MSYDVTALFTSVPVDRALEVITERLHEDDTLTSRTEIIIPQIVELLDFCLSTTYFIYDGAYYQQTHGAAIGSPIYRKPTHTDQYLNFKSHHPLTHKRSVVRTLANRAQQYVTTAEDRKSELAHVHNALIANRYPEWAHAPPPSSSQRPPNTKNNPRKSMLGLLYVDRLSKQHGRIYRSHNIHMYHKPAYTLSSMIVHPKDKTPKEHQCGTIYNITCDIDSSHTYIGETKRTLSQRHSQRHTNLDIRESLYHEQRSGIPSACHLQTNYPAEI